MKVRASMQDERPASVVAACASVQPVPHVGVAGHAPARWALALATLLALPVSQAQRSALPQSEVAPPVSATRGVVKPRSDVAAPVAPLRAGAASAAAAMAPAPAAANPGNGPTSGTPTTATEFDCLIEPMQIIELRSPVPGLLQQVHAKRGELVRTGQLLITIESSVEQSAVASASYKADAQGALQLARNKVAAAREKARRMTELQAEEFVSAQARDDAVAEAKLAESELKQAEESSQMAKLEHRQTVDQLNRRQLRSPFNGVVMDQYLYPGAMVDPNDSKKPILKIAQTNPLAVQTILPYPPVPANPPGPARGGHPRKAVRPRDQRHHPHGRPG